MKRLLIVLFILFIGCTPIVQPPIEDIKPTLQVCNVETLILLENNKEVNYSLTLITEDGVRETILQGKLGPSIHTNNNLTVGTIMELDMVYKTNRKIYKMYQNLSVKKEVFGMTVENGIKWAYPVWWDNIWKC